MASLIAMSQRWLFLAATAIAALGALNWATIEFFEYDILIDLLSLETGSSEYRAVVAVIGLAGLAALYWELIWLDMIDTDMTGGR